MIEKKRKIVYSLTCDKCGHRFFTVAERDEFASFCDMLVNAASEGWTFIRDSKGKHIRQLCGWCNH